MMQRLIQIRLLFGVQIREGDEEEEEIVNGNSLEGLLLSSLVL